MPPSIMSDDTYVLYGGQTGTSAASQRDAAYIIAEQLAEEELGTFLTETRTTGTYPIPVPGRSLQLGRKRVHSIDSVVLMHGCSLDCTIDECDGCAFIINSDAGIIKVTPKWGSVPSCTCGCGAAKGYPYLYRIVYTAGCGSGINTHPNFLLALTIVAEIALQQITDPGASQGGPGDPGIQSWSNMRYRQENRWPAMSRLGLSPRAQYATHLLRGFKKRRALKLG
jgi:hypothetical protein